MKRLARYSMGIGDRFGQQGRAQLAAFQRLLDEKGVEVTPVWNKSHREHALVGSAPDAVRRAADNAVLGAGWTRAYHVDADHVGIKNVDPFVKASDFFTLDVAEYLGETIEESEIYGFIARRPDLIGSHAIEGLPEPMVLTRHQVAEDLRGVLFAIRQAGRLYRHIAARKGSEDFIAELSLDEALLPQTPPMMLVICAALAEEGIPVQTLAPRFTGRFNKGVDYVGNPEVFSREFEGYACVARYAARRFGLPETLKLSIHSGSDKFTLYPLMAAVVARNRVGVHLKTAGTTWLEEVAGLALAGGEGLTLVKELYARALPRFNELCAPYAAVIDIARDRLPRLEEVESWNSGLFAGSLRHAPGDTRFNADFRQFMHVAFKIAAEMGSRYLNALARHEAVVARQVTENLYARHLLPLFGGLASVAQGIRVSDGHGGDADAQRIKAIPDGAEERDALG